MRVCGVCGEENPARARFCSNCGSPLAETAGTEERKVVTVLFGDIVASTELAARYDPEDLRTLLQPYLEAMGDEIARHGGTVDKFMGDAAMGIFGTPIAHEDDPVRAIRAALAIQARVASLNEGSAARGGVPLSVRVGVNTGEVVVSADAKRGEAVTGEAVHVAARLQAATRPGTVVVGDRTYRDARHAFAFRPLGDLMLKGIPDPVRAWEVEEERTEGGEWGGARTVPFVGRQYELDLLRILFARVVREPAASLVTIVGAPGVGKTRLAQEFVSTVTHEFERARVVRGRCLPYGEGLTYWPLVEILKHDAGILDSDPPEGIIAKAKARIEARFADPEVAEGVSSVLLSSIGVDVRPDPLSGVEAEKARELIARSWRSYVESLATAPLVVVVEDLHWADPSLVEVLESLAARLTGPVLLLCLTRPELAERHPDWAGGLPNAISLTLAPLTEEESAALLRHLLDSNDVPEAVRRILGRAEGNPFFIEELVRMLIEEGSLVRGGTAWELGDMPASLPDTVQGVIASRIDRLPPEQKRTIQDAAVVGRTFWMGAVERLGTPDAAEALERLTEKGLVSGVDQSSIAGDREFSFSHVLIRDVAYASIPRARRSQVHAQVGAWVEEVTKGRAEEFAEILAHHFEPAGDRERTARYGMLAGHRKLRLFSGHDAISWYDRALRAAGELPEERGRRLVAEIALSRGRAHELLSRFREAEADYARSLEAARAAGDGRREAEALAALTHIYRAQDRYDEVRPVQEEALSRARAVGANDLVVRILYTAGASAFDRAEWRESLAYQEEALKVAMANADLEGEAFACHGLCETRFFVGPFEEGLAQGLRSSELFRRLGNRLMLSHNEYMVGHHNWILGRLEEAERAYEVSVTGSRDLGDRWDEGVALVGRGTLRLSQGRLGEAVADALRAVGLMEDVPSRRLKLVARALGPLVAYGEFRAMSPFERFVAEARSFLDSLGTGYMAGRVLPCEGWLALLEGDRGVAHATFERARDASRHSLSDLLAGLRTEVLAWEEAEDAEGLESAGRVLRDTAGDQSPVYVVWGEAALARAALLRGEAQVALGLASSAFENARGIGELPVVWRAAATAADSLEALGRREEAVARRAEAQGVVRRMIDSIDDEDLRSAFTGRRDVSRLLA